MLTGRRLLCKMRLFDSDPMNTSHGINGKVQNVDNEKGYLAKAVT